MRRNYAGCVLTCQTLPVSESLSPGTGTGTGDVFAPGAALDEADMADRHRRCGFAGEHRGRERRVSRVLRAG